MRQPKKPLAACAGLSLVAAALFVAATTTRAGRAPQTSCTSACPEQVRQEFHTTGIGVGSTSHSYGISTMAWARYVIEHVSVTIRVPSGQTVNASLRVKTGGVEGRHRLVMTRQGTFGGSDVYVASQPVRLYADISSTIFFDAERSGSAGSAASEVAISGHAVVP